MSKPKTCRWAYNDYIDAWETSCGQDFILDHGTPEENHMNYCYHCGKELMYRKRK